MKLPSMLYNWKWSGNGPKSVQQERDEAYVSGYNTALRHTEVLNKVAEPKHTCPMGARCPLGADCPSRASKPESIPVPCDFQKKERRWMGVRHYIYECTRCGRPRDLHDGGPGDNYLRGPCPAGRTGCVGCDAVLMNLIPGHIDKCGRCGVHWASTDTQKTVADCAARFNNTANFGGLRYVPKRSVAGFKEQFERWRVKYRVKEMDIDISTGGIFLLSGKMENGSVFSVNLDQYSDSMIEQLLRAMNNGAEYGE